ncbi:putative DNA repair endonuclease XPF [Blattamonas nauphoetae]|uniref:DNA repair endonuclease XPF n=1 Tax=Blattamonas nauphoetae TaxID=2049346 RepID=A0ABQ9XCT7_9EUKA|nr:putative DNA repair endonuclease XPF [Blattamonas nauphoetae]
MESSIQTEDEDDIPRFIEEILCDIISLPSTLLVLSEGFGERLIVNSLIKLYASTDRLVFILNDFQSNQYDYQSVNGVMWPQELTSQLNSSQRMDRYLRGGVYSHTTAILSMDVLRSNIPFEQLSALIILDAHKVSDNSKQSFLIEMIREKNPNVYIHAISSSAGAFSTGYNRLEHQMSNLGCETLLLYPRFLPEIENEMKQSKPNISEVIITVSDITKRIEEILYTIIGHILHRAYSLIPKEEEVAPFELEQVMTKSFDSYYLSLVGGPWDRNRPHGIQILGELQTLRRLLYSLHRLDSLTYRELIERTLNGESVLNTETTVFFPGMMKEGSARGEWLAMQECRELAGLVNERAGLRFVKSSLADVKRFLMGRGWRETETVTPDPLIDADPIVKTKRTESSPPEDPPQPKETAFRFLKAKARTVEIEKTDQETTSQQTKPEMLTVTRREFRNAEENEKWLSIRRMIANLATAHAPHGPPAKTEFTQNRILVVSDSVTRRELKLILSSNGEDVLRSDEQKFNEYEGLKMAQRFGSQLLHTSVTDLSEPFMTANETSQSEQMLSEFNGMTPSTEEYLSEAKTRQRMIENEIGTQMHEGIGMEGLTNRLTEGGDDEEERGDAESIPTPINKNIDTQADPECIQMEKLKEQDVIFSQQFVGADEEALRSQPGFNRPVAVTFSFPSTSEFPNPLFEKRFTTGTLAAEQLGVPLVCLATSVPTLTNLLCEFDPHFVIVAQADPFVVRQVELFYFIHRQTKMDSSEADHQETKNQADVYFYILGDTFEQKMFEYRVEREQQSFVRLRERQNKLVIPRRHAPLQEMKTRSNDQPRIIVDTREFRALLPLLLSRSGFDVDVQMIEVGDYVLSPNICVERKAPSDLVMSLRTDHLHNQTLNLTRMYATPILLVEFDPKTVNRSAESLFSARPVVKTGRDRVSPQNFQRKPFLPASSNSGPSFHSMTSEPAQLQTGQPEYQPSTFQKLLQLTLKFPTLRVVWTYSPEETVRLFYELKQNEPNPVATGSTSSDGKRAKKEISRSIASRLKGMTQSDLSLVAYAGQNLSELASQSKSRMEDVMGKGRGEIVHSFLNRQLRLEDSQTLKRKKRPAPKAESNSLAQLGGPELVSLLLSENDASEMNEEKLRKTRNEIQAIVRGQKMMQDYLQRKKG